MRLTTLVPTIHALVGHILGSDAAPQSADEHAATGNRIGCESLQLVLIQDILRQGYQGSSPW